MDHNARLDFDGLGETLTLGLSLKSVYRDRRGNNVRRE